MSKTHPSKHFETFPKRTVAEWRSGPSTLLRQCTLRPKPHSRSPAAASDTSFSPFVAVAATVIASPSAENQRGGIAMSRKSATWPKASIHTPRTLGRQARRLDRRNNGVEGVLAEMRRGTCLHLSYAPRPHWRLSNGTWVTDGIARAVIALPSVTGVGDVLFAGLTSQTYRYLED
jgi:hypothetical protein